MKGKETRLSILSDLLDTLKEDVQVRSVLVGAHWTLVCSRYGGLASTLTADRPHGHESVRDAGRLHEKSARELAEYALSDNLLERSIGVAAINSLIGVNENLCVQVNASEVLAERGRGKTVALVGHFPFIPKLRPAVGELLVIEQYPAEGEYAAEAAPDVLPRADMVAITGSALINGTLDSLLALCPRGVPVMVLGPSTPLSPVLFEHGATILSGARVVDENAAALAISQAASFQQMKGVRLLSMMNEKER
jgi:hypothetical protein